MLNRWIDLYCRALGALMVLCLTLMVLMVFTNVVLRYAFNSGINVSEELSRWLFVWMTFMGAVVALRQRGHLGTDMLVGRLSPAGKRLAMGATLLLMLLCMGLIFKGTYEQFLVNKDSLSPVMEASMGWFYACGMAFAVLGAPILLQNLYRLVTGQLDDANLMLMRESEEAPHAPADSAK